MGHKHGLSRGVWLFLLILWGLFLVAMYHWGELGKYFQASPYYYFTAASGVLFVLAALKGVFWPSVLHGDCACDHEAIAGEEPEEGHEHEHAAVCTCGEHQTEPAGWWPLAKAIALLAVLAAPILMGLIVPFGSLNSLAAQRRGGGAFDPQSVLTAYSAQQQHIFQIERGYSACNPLEIINLVYSRPDPDPAPPKVVTIVLASRPQGLPDGYFVGVRFKMTCCAADAMPIEVLVRWPSASTIEDDTWVKVLGAARRETINGHTAVVVTADEVAVQKDGPEQPYIQ